MSESSLSDAPPSAIIPSDLELEQALRKQVRDALKSGKDDQSITVASMRKAAEEALGLEVGFYKKNQKWKEESKRIVHEAFEEHEADTTSPAKSKPQDAKPSTSPKVLQSKKRASPSDEGGAAKKRRRSQPVLKSGEAISSPSSELSEEEQEPAPKPKSKKSTKNSPPSRKLALTKSHKSRKPTTKASESELSDAPDEPTRTEKADTSESDLSVPIDAEPPPKSRKKQSKNSTEKRGRKPSTTSKTKPDTADHDPDAAEIKRLQGWLVKCGIRKLWGKELKPYNTSKAKIKHLKDLLANVGMTGRYSIEKASQIKEERELRADIEAVKEGAERWGKNNDEDDEEADDGDGRTVPKRRLVRGAQVLDFLGSDEGEETD